MKRSASVLRYDGRGRGPEWGCAEGPGASAAEFAKRGSPPCGGHSVADSGCLRCKRECDGDGLDQRPGKLGRLWPRGGLARQCGGTPGSRRLPEKTSLLMLGPPRLLEGRRLSRRFVLCSVHQAVRCPCQARAGFSLLELILALAILALSIAAISQLVRMGLAHARHARELTKAELYCESTMAELAAGVLPLEGVTGIPIEEDSEWLYSVSVEPAPVDGLLIVTVTVYQAEPDPVRPIEFTLVRWLADPAVYATDTSVTLGRGVPGGVPAFQASIPAPQARPAQCGWDGSLHAVLTPVRPPVVLVGPRYARADLVVSASGHGAWPRCIAASCNSEGGSHGV